MAATNNGQINSAAKSILNDDQRTPVGAPGVDMEIIEDFFIDFREAHLHCEHVLIQLERDPADQSLLNTLFRSVHTIKGNLLYVDLKEISPILQSVEDVLDAIRHHKLAYDTSLSDVILLAMDATKNMVNARIKAEASPISNKRLSAICMAIGKIVSVAPEDLSGSIRDAILLLDPSTVLPDASTKKIEPKNPTTSNSELATVLNNFAIEQDSDFQLFLNMVEPQESRSHYWSGRTVRVLDIALSMNDNAGSPVAPTQLSAAVLMRDIGMSFLPLTVLHKVGKLTSDELRFINSHPRTGFDLLKRMDRWDDAAEIILQHHERVDGAGYPKGLRSVEICTGAKIIAIADTFEARTHERAHVTHLKRPFARAVLEINKCSGAQFCEQWVDVFNNTIREQRNR